MLGQVELVAEHAILASRPMLLGCASLRSYGIVMVVIVLLIRPVHNVFILERFIARTQITQALVDM